MGYSCLSVNAGEELGTAAANGIDRSGGIIYRHRIGARWLAYPGHKAGSSQAAISFIGRAMSEAEPARRQFRYPRILFYAVNGLGLGHVTRLLAIARAVRELEPNAEIVFFTSSEAE